MVEHDHVARHQGGAEDLLGVGGEDVAVDGPAPGHGRLQPVRGQGGDHRHIWPTVQRHPVANALPAFGAGVVAAVDEVGAGFVYKLKSSNLFFLNRFDKGPAPYFYPFGVALGGGKALFFAANPAPARPAPARTGSWPARPSPPARPVTHPRRRPGIGASRRSVGPGPSHPSAGRVPGLAAKPPRCRMCGGGSGAWPRKSAKREAGRSSPGAFPQPGRPPRHARVNQASTLS